MTASPDTQHRPNLGFDIAGGLVIVPVNFAYDGHSIVIRTGAGSVIAHLQGCADVLPWPHGEHDTFVRITPQKISGRCIVHP